MEGRTGHDFLGLLVGQDQVVEVDVLHDILSAFERLLHVAADQFLQITEDSDKLHIRQLKRIHFAPPKSAR